MTNHDYKQNAYYLLYLIRCVLNNRIPSKEKLDKLDLEQLYEVAQAHSLSSICAYAIESAGIIDTAFEEAKNRAIRKNIILDVEREGVINELEEAGIWYMPLKGAILKDLYPQIGMRQMADNDILCDETMMDQVKNIMEKCGFTTVSYGESHQDVYQKPPVCNFEMHGRLFEPRHNKQIYQYYLSIKSKLLKDENNAYGYHFSDEDFYVFMIAHEYKHFMGTGTGLRSLLDTYVFLKNYNDSLCWEDIDNTTALLGMEEFERNNRSLAMHLFAGAPLSSEEKKQLDYYIFSGTYGRLENRIYNSLGEDRSIIGKVKYAYSRIKLPEQTLKEFHPFYYKHKLLRPLLYTKRLWNKSQNGSDALKKEVRQLASYRSGSSEDNSLKAKLKRIVHKISNSPFSKLAKKAYDVLIMAEYRVLVIFWSIKKGRRTDKADKEKVAQNITFIYKSFERQYMAKRLFRNIQKYYPGAQVIIADDSSTPLKINSAFVKIIQLPFNSGLSYGLNRALAEVKTPYTYRMDDDELLTPLSKIHEELNFLEEHNEIDLVGIQACSAPFPEKPQNKAKRYMRFDMRNAPKPLIIPHMTKIDEEHYVVGKISNTFLVRTDKYKQIGYDDNIQRIDHHEFFYRAAGNIVSAMDTSAFVFHYHNWFDRHYTHFRNQTAEDMKYIRKKHGNSY